MHGCRQVRNIGKLKLHSLFFGIAILAMTVALLYAYLASNTLSGTEDSKQNVKDFYQYKGYLSNTNYIGTALLLLFSNIIYARRKLKAPFVWTALFFVSLTLLSWWWLSEKVFDYTKTNDLWMGESNIGPVLGVFIALLGVGVVILNYWLLTKIFYENKDISQAASGENIIDQSEIKP